MKKVFVGLILSFIILDPISAWDVYYSSTVNMVYIFVTEDEYDNMMDDLLGDGWTLSTIGPLNSEKLNDWLANVFAERIVEWYYTPQAARDTWETTTNYDNYWDNKDLASDIKLKLTRYSHCFTWDETTGEFWLNIKWTGRTVTYQTFYYYIK
jgi:hypothetical protein